MSTARWGKKWADVDEDEEEEDGGLKANEQRFETKADEHGIKTIIEYTERNGSTYRITRKVKQAKVTKWTNKFMIERKSLPKFGKAATNTPQEEKQLIVKSVEEINIEIAKKTVINLSQKDDAEEKFYEESLTITENLLKEKKVWTDMNKEKHNDVVTGVGEEKKDETTTADAPNTTGKYVPPSLRGAQGEGKGGKEGKGKGKGGNQDEASLRVFNLSEDVKEGDLQDLFSQCGRLSRVYLAKDQETFLSKGFAFVTYYNREDAQRAIDRLNGHGYDNLIMKVEWAKPRA